MCVCVRVCVAVSTSVGSRIWVLGKRVVKNRAKQTETNKTGETNKIDWAVFFETTSRWRRQMVDGGQRKFNCVKVVSQHMKYQFSIIGRIPIIRFGEKADLGAPSY